MNTSHISQPENYKTNNWKMRRQPTPAAAMSYNIVLHYKTCHINKLYSSSRTQNLKYFKNQTSLRYVLNIRLSLKIFINFIVSDIGGCRLTDLGLEMKATSQQFSVTLSEMLRMWDNNCLLGSNFRKTYTNYLIYILYSNRKYMRIFMHGLVFLLCQTWAKRNKNIKRQNINVAGLVINVGSVKDREMVLVRGRLHILFSYVVPSCSWT